MRTQFAEMKPFWEGGLVSRPSHSLLFGRKHLQKLGLFSGRHAVDQLFRLHSRGSRRASAGRIQESPDANVAEAFALESRRLLVALSRDAPDALCVDDKALCGHFDQLGFGNAGEVEHSR